MIAQYFIHITFIFRILFLATTRTLSARIFEFCYILSLSHTFWYSLTSHLATKGSINDLTQRDSTLREKPTKERSLNVGGLNF